MLKNLDLLLSGELHRSTVHECLLSIIIMNEQRFLIIILIFNINNNNNNSDNNHLFKSSWLYIDLQATNTVKIRHTPFITVTAADK